MQSQRTKFIIPAAVVCSLVILVTAYIHLRRTPSVPQPHPAWPQILSAPFIHYPTYLPTIRVIAPKAVTLISLAHGLLSSPCITAVVQDGRGRWWVGTEGQGVFCYTAKVGGHGTWRHFNSRNFAPNNVYALACDGMGRIWAGSLGHGVCVYNGKRWRDYDLIPGLGYGPVAGATAATHQHGAAGPLGQRVFAMATSPLDGSVWIATSKGLTRYYLHKNIWRYYTTATGLPSDALSCLTFAPDGTLFVGTQCDGIAYASPRNHYHTWTRVTGPQHLPLTATGLGLPCNLINTLLVVPRKQVHRQWRYTTYAGTDAGLAIGDDNGRNWRFIRGRNYVQKIKGLWHVPAHWPKPSAAVEKGLLSSDYITCLAMDADGNVWMGHRRTGVEVFNPTGTSATPTLRWLHDGLLPSTGFVASLVALTGGGMLICGYQSGLSVVYEKWAGQVRLPQRPPATGVPPLPAGAGAPSTATLNRWIARVQRRQGRAVSAAFAGDDWRTEGDWLGRYGVAYARLCVGTVNYADAEEQFFGGLSPAFIQHEPSPHQYAGDRAFYVAWFNSKLLRTLYYPDMAQRVEGEWNDAGGRYPRTFDGPDMWLKVKVPAGLYRLSFYFHNKDAQTGENDVRDFVVQIYPQGQSPAYAWQHEKPLAQGRVMQFWGGVYTTFLLRGPASYQVRLKRNYGYWMTVAGMFMDRICGPKDFAGYTNLDGLPIRNYRPATYNVKGRVAASPAWRLWKLLDARASHSRANLGCQWPARLLAYRYAQIHHYPPALLARWRWKLCIWEPADRSAFNRVMAKLNSSLSGR